jgi:mannose/fructose/N-acetylgalactosamine-specific phosphotransferase system component IID
MNHLNYVQKHCLKKHLNQHKMEAVEWLYEQMPIKIKPHYKKQLEQAKEMEKEQKIQFANEYSHAVMGGCLLTPTEFYNETFK